MSFGVLFLRLAAQINRSKCFNQKLTIGVIIMNQESFLDEATATKIEEANVRLHNEKAIEFDEEEAHMHKKRFIEKNWGYVNYIADHVKDNNPSLLDIGCGTGNLSIKFLKKGFKVKGVDISQGMIDLYRKNTKDKAETVVSSIGKFLTTETEKYDVIAFNAVLHHIPYYLDTINQSCKLLKSGGFIFINYEMFSKKDMKQITKWLHKIDIALYGILFKWRKHRDDFFPAILRKLHLAKNSQQSEDILFADYHVFHGGLNVDEIVEIISQNNCEIVKLDKYHLLRINLLNFIGKLFKANSFFSIIGKQR